MIIEINQKENRKTSLLHNNYPPNWSDGAAQIEEWCSGNAIEFLADFCTWTPSFPSAS